MTEEASIARETVLIPEVEHIAQFAMDTVQNWQEGLRKGKGELPLHELVSSQCTGVNVDLVTKATSAGMKAAIVESNCYVAGENAPHMMAVIDLGAGRGMLVDGSIAQHTGNDNDIALVVVGTRDELKAFSQREFGGSWDRFDEEQIIDDDYTLDSNNLTLTEPSNNSPRCEIRSATGMVPLTEEEIKADFQRRNLQAIRDEKKFDYPTMHTQRDEGLVMYDRTVNQYVLTASGKIHVA